MKPRIVIVAVAFLLGGCAALSLLPPEARVIARAAVSSDVWKPKLRISDGAYSVEGFVQRNYRRLSTADSYLDVALFNAAGDKLKEEKVNYTPAELPFRIGRPGRYGNYSLTLDALPPGTARIEVRAQDASTSPGG